VATPPPPHITLLCTSTHIHCQHEECTSLPSYPTPHSMYARAHIHTVSQSQVPPLFPACVAQATVDVKSSTKHADSVVPAPTAPAAMESPPSKSRSKSGAGRCCVVEKPGFHLGLLNEPRLSGCVDLHTWYTCPRPFPPALTVTPVQHRLPLQAPLQYLRPRPRRCDRHLAGPANTGVIITTTRAVASPGPNDAAPRVSAALYVPWYIGAGSTLVHTVRKRPHPVPLPLHA
jgi:hypothetical protein